MQESAATVKNWGPYSKLTYPLLLDRNRTVWNKYGMGYIPHNVVLDPEMIVRYTTYGYNELAIIAVVIIAIVGVVAFWVLRKRK